MPSDVLFNSMVQFQGDVGWGRFLDAGTGLHSLKWIQGIPTSSWTAITADQNMRSNILSDEAVAAAIRPDDMLVVGNWMDEQFCSQLGMYDTILADYLIGAVDGFSPYEQDNIIKKLKDHLNPEGRLYFIGMNPIPDEPALPTKIISEVRQARDAAILLAGHRMYREFPLTWMLRHISNVGLESTAHKKYTIMHSEVSVTRQIKVAQSKLSLMTNASLRNGMEKYLFELEGRVRDTMRLNGGKIPLSFDYVIMAQHSSTNFQQEQGQEQEEEQGQEQVYHQGVKLEPGLLTADSIEMTIEEPQ